MANQKKDLRTELQGVAEKLRDPFRMRVAVAVAAILLMFFGISEPLHGKIKQSKRERDRLKVTINGAEEVLLLREALTRVDSRIIQGVGTDVIVSHLISVVGQQDVELLSIDAGTPTRMGPLHSVGVKMDARGEFAALMNLVHAIESGPYLVRVDSVAIRPPEMGADRSSMTLSVSLLKEPS
ncbi:MAG: GspMb/PilO family protein [Planctomycetota bacterium]